MWRVKCHSWQELSTLEKNKPNWAGIEWDFENRSKFYGKGGESSSEDDPMWDSVEIRMLDCGQVGLCMDPLSALKISR